MRFILYRREGEVPLGPLRGASLLGPEAGGTQPSHLQALLAAGPDAIRLAYDTLIKGGDVARSRINQPPPLPFPGKVIYVNLSYEDHAPYQIRRCVRNGQAERDRSRSRPEIFKKPGNVCEDKIEASGILSNPIVGQA